MRRPNMARAVGRWSRPVTVKTVTTVTVDFVPTDTVAARTIDAMVQVADKSKLNPEAIDWSLEYLLVHTTDATLTMGEFVEHGGGDYKVIDLGPWNDYGYRVVTAEQTKRPLLVVTP